jgi:hypothetical protein
MTTEIAIKKIQAIVRGNISRSKMLWPCAICKKEAPYCGMTQIHKKWRCPDCSQGWWAEWGGNRFYVCPCNRSGCEKGCRLLNCGCVNTCKEGYDCPALRAKGIHYCGDMECDRRCGVLWCGCIDVCRGRCGVNDPRDGW